MRLGKLFTERERECRDQEGSRIGNVEKWPRTERLLTATKCN